MERFGENREVFDPREALERLLSDYTEIQNFDTHELQAMLDLARAMLIEVDPAYKHKYKALISLLTHAIDSSVPLLAGPAAGRNLGFILDDEYRISAEGKSIDLKAYHIIRKGYANISHPVYWNLLKRDQINRADSNSVSCFISTPDQSLNLVIYIYDIALTDGSRKRILYITDRTVAPALRGHGYGKALAELAENIARMNQCSIIFSILVPEGFMDPPRFRKGKEEAGYTVTMSQQGTVAVKEL